MDKINKLAEIFKALADPTRLTIVKMLTKHEFLCVNAIAHNLDVTQSAVSQHLKLLYQTGLVLKNRKGSHIHYQLNKEMLKNFRYQVLTILGEDFIVK